MSLLLQNPLLTLPLPLSRRVGLPIPLLRGPLFSQRTVGGTDRKYRCTYNISLRPLNKSRRTTLYPLSVKRRDDEEELTTATTTTTTTTTTAGKMGVEKQVLKTGNGPKPVRGQNVTVHCTGFGKNGDLGQKFWSTKDPGQQPFTFKIGQGSVIKGWDEGVADMQIGEVARLQCTPDYAYGPSGFPAWGILPNSVLVFEIEVLSAQ